ncbi:hypothetical protein D3C81_1409430 [compost metagenome]
MRLACRAYPADQAGQGQGLGQRGLDLPLRRPPELPGAAQAGDHPLRLAPRHGYRRPRRQDRRTVGRRGAGPLAGRSLHTDLRAGGGAGGLRRAVHPQPAGGHRRQQAAYLGALHLRPRHPRCRRGDGQAAGSRPRCAGAHRGGPAGGADLAAGRRPGSGPRDPQLLRGRAQPHGDRPAAGARRGAAGGGCAARRVRCLRHAGRAAQQAEHRRDCRHRGEEPRRRGRQP